MSLFTYLKKKLKKIIYLNKNNKINKTNKINTINKFFKLTLL